MKIYFFIIIFFLLGFSNSYSQVSLTITQPPPNQFFVEDLWRISIINSGKANRTIYLKGIVTESSQGNLIEATTRSFVIAPGINALSAKQLGNIDIAYKDNTIKQVIENTGGFPSGNYEICVTAYEDATNIFLASDCLVRNLNNLTPPVLIAPLNESVVTQKLPVFSWVPPNIVNKGSIKYKLKIVEMYFGQSPYEAFQSNLAFYENSNVFANVFQYPFISRDLDNRSKYAWRISVLSNNIILSESEISYFIFESSDDTSNTFPVVNKKAKGNGNSGEMLFASNNDEDFQTWLASKKKIAVSDFSIKGRMRVVSQFSNKSGLGQQLPPGNGRLEANPIVSIGDFPFSMNALVSTLPVQDKQNINYIGFNFEQEQFFDNIKNKQSKSGLEGFVSDFNQIGFGTVYPEYTDLTVSGVAVTGANFQYEPGLILLGLSGINSQKSVVNEQNELTALERNFASGRIGVGKFESSHLLFTYLNGWESDNPGALNPQQLNPAKNYILGANGRLSFFENALNLEAEFNGSLYTRDKNAPDVEDSAVPEFIKNLFTVNISSSYDYSYAFRGSYKIAESGTTLSAGYKYIGPGYKTFGNPELNNDKRYIDGKIEQQLWNNRISLSAFVRHSRDNLIDWKTYTTELMSFGFSGTIRPDNLPYLSISYSPFKQKNDHASDTLKIDNDIASLSMNTGYNFESGGIYYFTGVNFTRQSSSSFRALADYAVNSIIVNESVSFLIPLSLSASFGYTNLEYFGTTDKVYSYDLSAGYTFFENWQNTIGGLYNNGSTENRATIYLQSTIPVFDIFNFDARIEHSLINLAASKRNETILKVNMHKTF